jgi:hypothetical protein
MAVNNIRRNPFWQVICTELDKAGFKLYEADHHNSDYKVVIQGVDKDGKHVNQHYIFARICRMGRAVQNFRSEFRRFVNIDLPNRQFYPRDHHTRQPGMFVQKINHDVPKKQLTTPLPMKRALADGTLPDILVWPTLPETFTGDRTVKLKKDVGPLSTTKSIAAFLVENADLSTLLELMNGLAVLRGVKPAPITITGEQITSVIAQQPPSVTPPLAKVEQTPTNIIPIAREVKNRVAEGGPGSIQGQVVAIINANPNKVFTSEDFKALIKNRNSLSATLSVLASAARITRIGRGQYKASTEIRHRKQKA